MIFINFIYNLRLNFFKKKQINFFLIVKQQYHTNNLSSANISIRIWYNIFARINDFNSGWLKM